MKGRCNRCGMDIDCKPYEDTWLCRDCMQEVDTTRATYFIADMDFQKKHAADCLIKLKALRAEEEHGD